MWRSQEGRSRQRGEKSEKTCVAEVESVGDDGGHADGLDHTGPDV